MDLTPEQFNELMFIIVFLLSCWAVVGLIVLVGLRIIAWFAATFIGWIMSDLKKR